MPIVRTALLGLASPIALAATTIAAHAQAAEPAAAVEAQEAPAGGDNEIVVTAQLIQQTPIEVPFALTAYSGKFLDDMGITEFDRLGQFVPGFSVQNQSPNNPGFVMRGLTSDDGSAFGEARVSVFQDGVPISKSRGSYVELFDMQRVEIAKGPQSTLYGRGALIGAVNLVEAKADPSKYDAYFYGSYGNYNAYRIDATMNVPLADDLAVRVAGRVKERDGYTKNLLGGKDFNGLGGEAIRGSLHWNPGALTFDLIGNYQHDTTTGTSFKSLTYVPTDPTTGAVRGDLGRNSGAALASPATFYGGRPLGVDRDVWGVTGIANYELNDNWSLNAIGSYRKFNGIEVFDPDGTSLPIFTAAEKAVGDQTTGTLRLTYTQPDRITAFVGATYYYENGYQNVPIQFDERYALVHLANALYVPGLISGGGLIPGRPANVPAPASVLTSNAFLANILQGLGVPSAAAPTYAAMLNPNYLEVSTNYSKTKSFDLFGDVTVHLGERFELGGGLRYTHDDKTTGYASSLHGWLPGGGSLLGSLISGQPLSGIAVQPTANNGDRIDQGLTDDGFTWRLIARYALNDDASLYANYARGRRPSILSVDTPAVPYGSPVFTKLAAETVDSFEVGAKTALAGRTLFVDGAVFYYKYKHFQTTELRGTTFVSIDAGDAESYGFEGQINWRPAPWTNLFANYAYNHGRFTSLARNGNRFRLSPDHTASAGMTLQAPVGPVRIDVTPSISYQSKVFFDDDNDRPDLQAQKTVPDLIQDEYQNGYALADLRLGVETVDGRYRLEGFVTNLFNQKFIKDAGNSGDNFGLATFVAGEPRFYGLAFSMKMGRR